MINENLSIGFIGAGRVGCTLGRCFFEKKITVSGYFSNEYAHACQAAEFTSSKAYTSLKQLLSESSVIFLTVPDLKIYEVWTLLKNYEISGKIFCHCSGAVTSDVFDGIHSLGAYGFSVHPAFAVNDKASSYKKLQKAFFTVEGDDEKMYVIEHILHKIGNDYLVINPQDKGLYHTALTTASNLVIALYHMAVTMLEQCNFSPQDAVKVLNPLFTENACNLGNMKPNEKDFEKDNCVSDCIANALTGSVDRNDVTTVEKHLALLTDTRQREVYKLLTAELIDIAKEKYPVRDYSRLEELINDKR